MQNYLRQLKPNEEIGAAVEASPPLELSLLRWAQKTSGLFLAPELRTVETESGSLCRVTVSSEARKLGDPIIGCGRDFNLSSALSRAYGEVMERMIAQEIFERLTTITVSRLRISGSKAGVIGAEAGHLPPRGIRTSNGWAVHFHLATAIRNAYTEALERHILLYTFLKHGWRGFSAASEGELLGKKLQCLDSHVVIAGHRAGMVLAQLENYPGFTTGYVCAATANLESGEHWRRAMLEAAEPAVAIDNTEERQVHLQLGASDPLQRVQAHYALTARPDKMLDGTNELLSQTPELTANLLVVDVQEAWRLPFPFFAAYVFGEELIPLAFRQSLQNCTLSQQRVGQVLSRYQLAPELPDVHPVV